MKQFSVLLFLIITASTPALELNAETYTLDTRQRVRNASGHWAISEQKVLWSAKETAVIVCDMWDLHHCKNAVKRVGEMAPRMNLFLKEARQNGSLIIHAPSSCTKFYDNHPARQRAINTPKAKTYPKAIESWCHWIDKVEEQQGYPIDHSDGGEDDDPEEHAAWAKHLEEIGRNPRSPWKRQVDSIDIAPKRDAISDNGFEIWNLLGRFTLGVLRIFLETGIPVEKLWEWHPGLLNGIKIISISPS